VVIASTGAAVGLIISVIGTTASISSATLSAAGGAGNTTAVIVSGSKLIFLGVDSTGSTNILTDTAGTASAGTPIGPFTNLNQVIPISVIATDNLATFYALSSTTTSTRVVINFTGSSPILSDFDNQTAGTSSFPQPTSLNYKETFVPDFFIGATSYAWDVSVAGQRAVAVGENSFYSFAPKFIPIITTFNSITQNKVLAYNNAYSAGVVYGALQIIESVS
jgi:hypothetical protein